MTFAAVSQSVDSGVIGFDIPEHAILTFERIHKLNITVHDLAGTLSPFLKPSRFHHRSPLCRAVKAQGHHVTCVQFEVKNLRREGPRLPEGRIHVCHAGLVEWMIPVFEKKKLTWVLFAGPRLPGKGLTSAVRSRSTRWLKFPWGDGLALPPAVDEDEAQMVLEHLRQLAARLQKWAAGLKPRKSSGGRAQGVSSDRLTTRQATVLQFIEERYNQRITLSMLAKALCLSESRASHVIRASCGTSFRELLIQKRLGVAMELLRQSGMGVLEVAMESGFEDVAHFHRLFRRRTGTTPRRYRLGGSFTSTPCEKASH